MINVQSTSLNAQRVEYQKFDLQLAYIVLENTDPIITFCVVGKQIYMK